mgnify:CR=1 FL=1
MGSWVSGVLPMVASSRASSSGWVIDASVGWNVPDPGRDVGGRVPGAIAACCLRWRFPQV